MDMATAQCTYGSVEQALGRSAVAQLGRFYDLPTFNTGAGVEAKLPDAQAASEAMMGMLMNSLAGITMNQPFLETTVVNGQLAISYKRAEK